MFNPLCTKKEKDKTKTVIPAETCEKLITSFPILVNVFLAKTEKMKT